MMKRVFQVSLALASALSLTSFGFLNSSADKRVSAPIPGVCERTGDSLKQLSFERDMRLSFPNEGGIANGGVCWWHSRFQRAVWALADFAPLESKPTRTEARSMIHDLAHMNRVVIIPGYSNFNEFSRDFADLIQKELNRWQIRDGFQNQAWVRGLARRSSYSPSRAKLMMDRLYRDFQETSRRGHVTWVKLQMPGIVAHAALILDMIPDANEGYELVVVDSNFQHETMTWNFKKGDRFVETGFYGRVMPFSGYSRDLSRIGWAQMNYCHPKRVGQSPVQEPKQRSKQEPVPPQSG